MQQVAVGHNLFTGKCEEGNYDLYHDLQFISQFSYLGVYGAGTS
jgi:hypothetical protein